MMIKEHDKEYELFQINKTVSFDEFTLNKNHIKGEILLTHDKYHGSMLIKECNSKVTLQFIQSFPKINYYKNQTIAETTKINEKLDGSCICIYRLCDENGEFLEHVPKTRQKAVLNKHIQEMYQLCQIQNKFRKDISIESIFFEMYGMLNLHTIRHYKTYINLALIGDMMETTF